MALIYSKRINVNVTEHPIPINALSAFIGYSTIPF